MAPHLALHSTILILCNIFYVIFQNLMMLDLGAYINHLLRKKKFLSKGGGKIIKFLHWQLWDPSRKQQKLKNAFLNDVSVTFKQSFQKYHFSPISGIFWKCYLGFFFLSNFSVKLTLFSVLYICGTS